jgi:DNA-directed RNA polymerase specialized sigma24 family protein
MQDIERELITGAGQGDMRAFREIYARASGYVYTLAYRVVGTKHDAEEVSQHACFAGLQSVSSLLHGCRDSD